MSLRKVIDFQVSSSFVVVGMGFPTLHVGDATLTLVSNRSFNELGNITFLCFKKSFPPSF